ncbi:hypothetical protein [Paraburkholderia xenovorans]|uniref:hypothetical protein n=1 Tax=Paraburkholderia xenovorans TaxID=36873 RepID=UPI0038BC03F7
MVNAFSFACTACGKCCNSPPAMSLPELFRQRDRFIGCLAIGRVPRRRIGERVRVGRRGALARRRRALEREREVWGRAVFESLRKDLFDSPAALARIPPGGFLTISIVPALLAVASTSARCRQLCLDYIDSQLALIDRSIEQALLRRRLTIVR